MLSRIEDTWAADSAPGSGGTLGPAGRCPESPVRLSSFSVAARSWPMNSWTSPGTRPGVGCSASAMDVVLPGSTAESPPGRLLAAAAPVRLALVQERLRPLPRVGELAGRGHDLDGVGVGLGLVQVDLGVQRLLADALAVRRPAGDTLQEVLDGGVELSGRHDPVDQAPLQRGTRVDDVARHGHLRGPLAADVPGDGHHRGVAEPAALAPGGGKAGVFAGHG